MNKYLSHIADLYALSLLHREKSKECQFSADYKEPISVNAYKDFYREPKEEKIYRDEPLETKNSYATGKFSFQSEVLTPYGENNTAHGTNYEIQKENKANVIIVHGWRMESIKRIERIFLPSFVNKEYDIYFLTLPYHFERRPERSYNGEYLISANIDRTIQAVRQGVSDIRTLLKWVRNNKKGRIILLGVSLGGLLTNLTATIDDSMDYLVSLFYVDSLSYTTFYTIPAKFVRRDFSANRFSFDELKKYWDILQPSNFEPLIPKEKILLLSAQYDKYVAAEDSGLLYEAWDKPNRIICKCGHSGIVLSRRKISEEVNKFLGERI